jgi:hypothetical protein
LDKSLLKLFETKFEPEKIGDTCFQLREYARCLSGLQSYARFLQVEADSEEYKVPKEDEVEPSWDRKEKDREESFNLDRKYYDTYACFRIMRDGSIVVQDGGGSAVVMNGGNISMSARKNITLEAAGNIVLNAGQDVHVRARRHMELVAVVGGLKLKARTWMHSLCERGSMWFKTDALNKPKKSTNYKEDAPDEEIMEHGIIFDAPESSILLDAARQVKVHVLKKPRAPEGEDEKFEGGFDVQLDQADFTCTTHSGGINLYSKGADILLKATGSLAVKARSAVFDLTNKLFYVKNQFFSQGGIFDTQGSVHSTQVFTDYVFSKRVLGIPEEDKSPIPLRPHHNHVLLRSDDYEKPSKTLDPPEEPLEKVEKLDPAKEQPLADTMWDFQSNSDYKWRSDYELYESVTTQLLFQGDLDEIDSEFVEYKLDDTQLKQAKRTGQHAPFPGLGAQWWRSRGGESLYEPSSKHYKELKTSPEDWSKGEIKFKYKPSN